MTKDLLAHRPDKGGTQASPRDFRDWTLHGETEVLSDLDVELASRHFHHDGLFTSPSRIAALAAAQEDDPEVWVSPAPRSQIRMKSSFGPVGTAS